MWFLIKSTVFLCFTLVVLSFFSTDDQNESSLSAAGVTSAVLSAGEIVHYISGICVEKPDVCVKGAETLAVLSERTREGAKVAYQLLEGQLGDGDTQKKVTVAQPIPEKPQELVVADQIRTGTIAQPNLALAPSRIPVPMKRPIGL